MSRDYSPILKGILSAAASALNEKGVPAGRVELTPGSAPAWDDCCAGQLYIRVIEIFPTVGLGGGPFPSPDSAQRGVGTQCGFNLLAIHFGLGLIRCAATVDDNGNAPSPAAVTDDGDEMLADMATLLDVLICDSQDIPGIQRLKIGQWVPQGVDGGCHGGEWDAYIAVDPCLCKE